MTDTATLQVRLRATTYEASRILGFELVPLDATTTLPSFSAGAHIDVHLPGGLLRSYSLLNDPQETHRYCIGVNLDADISCLVHPREIELISMLSRMKANVERSCENLEPHTIAEYLRDLAGAYHNFYHDCRILGAEEPLESARLRLADVTRRAMRNGLMLLGVGTPERM